MDGERRIIHVDMDAFFASVEQLDNPELRGKPVIVGGNPEGRGVVAACSYEARKYGIHSAMPSSRARRLCPEAVFVRGHFERYRDVSCQIREIFESYTDLVEPLSLDEAYLDVTDHLDGYESATAIAREIRERIYATTGLTASAGVSYNKFLAKVASDYRKPDGLTVIPPWKADVFLDELPIGKFHGIGKRTEEKMKEMGVYQGGDLKKISRPDLVSSFGKAGEYYYLIARGIDERAVHRERERKSIGRERTFPEDRTEIDFLRDVLGELLDDVRDRAIRYNRWGKTLTVKVRYDDFTTITRSGPLLTGPEDREGLLESACLLLEQSEAGVRPVRLIGGTISSLHDIQEKSEPWGQLLISWETGDKGEIPK
jgi:DNA polymerase-4